ncbi:MAG: alanine/glycine:cation symporter family protein [Acidilobaceae archaeon]
MVLDTLINIINYINGIVWGLPAIIVLLGTGLTLTILLGAMQVRYFGTALRNMMWKGRKGSGEVHPFKIWAAVMGATVGIGNIAGVGTAVALGGPGALFWMFLTGLFGMALKAVEVTLGVKFRKVRADGTVVEGGTPYYIRQVPLVGGILAVLFALFAFISAFGIGNMVQASNVAFGAAHLAESYGLNVEAAKWLTGIVIFILVALVVLGGIRRIAEVAGYLVPFMGAWYILAGLGLWLMFAGNFIDAIAAIIKGAFAPMEVAKTAASMAGSPEAAAGGIIGWTTYEAIRYGVARGLFSNEAGLGSAPNAYAYGESDHPGRQGFYGMFEVFMDTLVICMITGVSVVITGAYTTGLTGAPLAMEAFSRGYGALAPLLVGVALILFALTTLLTWAWYGEVNWVYFWCKILKFPEQPMRLIWRILWVIPIIPAAVMARDYFVVFWDFSDTMNGLMAIPNLIAVIVLAPIAITLLRDFAIRYKELSRE